MESTAMQSPFFYYEMPIFAGEKHFFVVFLFGGIV